MGECIKVSIALVAMCFLFGCTARSQEATQIECTDRDGQILYTGPYIEENEIDYIVEMDDGALAVVRKELCRKVQA
ncbi:MAG TPA: hypothetical protein VF905_09540 [Nitrospirota bacterium]